MGQVDLKIESTKLNRNVEESIGQVRHLETLGDHSLGVFDDNLIGTFVSIE